MNFPMFPVWRKVPAITSDSMTVWFITYRGQIKKITKPKRSAMNMAIIMSPTWWHLKFIRSTLLPNISYDHYCGVYWRWEDGVNATSIGTAFCNSWCYRFENMNEKRLTPPFLLQQAVSLSGHHNCWWAGVIIVVVWELFVYILVFH